MTGPEHYRAAEQFLDAVAENIETASSNDELATDAVIGNALAAAQVHATLALAAATAEELLPGGYGSYKVWATVIS